MKNFVMDAKIDPKVVMDLSIFEIGGKNILQPPSNRKLLEEFTDEYESWLSVSTLNSYSWGEAATLRPAGRKTRVECVMPP